MRPAAWSTVTLDQLTMFIDIHCRRFAGRTDDHDTVGSFANVKVDQTAQGMQIEAAILVHGRDDGDNGSGNHGLFT
jgi:hypothetical protein